MNRLDRFLQPQFIIAIVIIGLFGWAYGENVKDETLKGALIAGFNIALGYYLGSSRGATLQAETTSKALDLAAGGRSA